MSAITVRRMKFEFPESLDDVLPCEDLVAESYLVAFSLMMPALEPYLIRTMRAVVPRIEDDSLTEEIKAFSGQEAQHFQNHRRVNEMILRQLGEPTASRIRSTLDDLDADYQRYTKRRTDKFNLVYAEGFEAMACAMGLTMFEEAAKGDLSAGFGPWMSLWAWHAAEEIEHRTVAFDAYELVIGSYLYRVVGSLRAQWHFQRYIDRLQREVLASRGERPKHCWPAWLRVREGRRRYRRTFRPSYNPTDIEPDPMIELVLTMLAPPADPGDQPAD